MYFQMKSHGIINLIVNYKIKQQQNKQTNTYIWESSWPLCIYQIHLHTLNKTIFTASHFLVRDMYTLHQSSGAVSSISIKKQL